VQHPESDHESEAIERSLTSTSSLVESESEEGHDRYDGNVCVRYENHDSEDVHTVVI